MHPDLKDYILSLQEALLEEHAIMSTLSSFMSLIKSVITSPLTRPKLLPFKFNTSKESLALNKKALENFAFNMERLTPAFKNNFITPRSEFRDLILLSPFLNYHKH